MHNKEDQIIVYEAEVGLGLRNDVKRIFLSCQMKDGCGDVTLTTSSGFISQTFYFKGPRWQVEQVRDVLQSFFPE